MFKQIRISRGLLESSPVERQPVGDPVIEACFEVVPRRQLVDQFVQQLLLARLLFGRVAGGRPQPWTEYGRQRRLANDAEAKFTVQHDRHASGDLTALNDFDGLPGAFRDRIQPPRLLKNAMRTHRPGFVRCRGQVFPRLRLKPFRPHSSQQ
jgi:hypothetical protein